MTKTRHCDRENEGRSNVVPYRHGEDAMNRHSRRKGINLQWWPWLDSWCQRNGLRLEVKNDGHHWLVFDANATGKDRPLFEWWPSSAKLIIDKQWRKGIHVHDVMQLTEAVESRIADRLAAIRKSREATNAATTT